MIDAGRLTKLITLQKPTKSKSAAGRTTITWSTVGKVWCEFAHTAAREFMAARQVNAKITDQLRIRHRDDVTSEWRAKYGDQILNFDGVYDPGQRREELMINAVRKSP